MEAYPIRKKRLILLDPARQGLNSDQSIQFTGTLCLSLFAIINMQTTVFKSLLIGKNLILYNSLIVRLKMQSSRLNDRPFTISNVLSIQKLAQIQSLYSHQLHQLFSLLQADTATKDISPAKLQNALTALQKMQQKQKDREEFYELTAKCFLLQEKYEEAIRQYRKAWKFSPGEAAYCTNIAICLMASENPYGAIKFLQKESSTHPDNPEIYSYLGVANWMILNYPQAIRNFRISYRWSSEIKEEFILRGKALLSDQRYEEALPFFVKWAIFDGNGEEALQGLKDCFIRSGRLEDGKQFYACLGEVEEYRWSANYSLALLSFESGDIKQAKHHLENGLKMSPDSFKLNLYLGIVCIQQGEYQRAITCLKKCLQTNPNNANALTSLSLAYMRTNDYEEAYKYSLESVKTNEKDSMSCYTHGIILLQRNEVDAGIKYLKKAIELDQSNYPALEKLASTLYLLGDESQADALVHRANKVKEDLSKS